MSSAQCDPSIPLMSKSQAPQSLLQKNQKSLFQGVAITLFEIMSKSLIDQKFPPVLAPKMMQNGGSMVVVNVARFARNVVKLEFFDDFQAMWIMKVHVRSYFHNSYLLKRFRAGESSLSISLSNHF